MSIDTSLYTNIWDYMKNDRFVFNFFIGGRRTGKTYSVLRELSKGEIPFLYLRMTGKETTVSIEADLFRKYKVDIKVKELESNFYSFYKDDKVIGYGASLSTFSGLRGVDFSNIKIIYFDEFIPELGIRRQVSNPAVIFKNLYETINENRELEGIPPAKVIATANSNDIATDLMQGLKLTKYAEEMLKNDQEFYFDKKRRYQLAILKSNPEFLKKKQRTALYEFIGEEDDFTKMSLNNMFAYNDFTNVKERSLQGLTPVCNISGLFTIFKQKNNDTYYVSPININKGCQVYDPGNQIEKQNMLMRWSIFLNNKYYSNKIKFATYESKKAFNELFL